MMAPTEGLEQKVLAVVEEAQGPLTVETVWEQLGEEAADPEFGQAVRALVGRGCILVTRDWKLVARPDHAQVH